MLILHIKIFVKTFVCLSVWNAKECNISSIPTSSRPYDIQHHHKPPSNAGIMRYNLQENKPRFRHHALRDSELVKNFKWVEEEKSGKRCLCILWLMEAATVSPGQLAYEAHRGSWLIHSRLTHDSLTHLWLDEWLTWRMRRIEARTGEMSLLTRGVEVGKQTGLVLLSAGTRRVGVMMTWKKLV